MATGDAEDLLGMAAPAAGLRSPAEAGARRGHRRTDGRLVDYDLVDYDEASLVRRWFALMRSPTDACRSGRGQGSAGRKS
jgi:hypothetical protein